ncbi:hypothetical protein N0V95_004761 [Ascochyta clinopodiicola]|nr:hypothetical protein N0V95_004761 [Ascochyta clinopodiicola]
MSEREEEAAAEQARRVEQARIEMLAREATAKQARAVSHRTAQLIGWKTVSDATGAVADTDTDMSDIDATAVAFYADAARSATPPQAVDAGSLPDTLASDDSDHEVQAILDMRPGSCGEAEYLVAWRGYPDDDTWESYIAALVRDFHSTNRHQPPPHSMFDDSDASKEDSESREASSEESPSIFDQYSELTCMSQGVLRAAD